jgi:hypothetical protein
MARRVFNDEPLQAPARKFNKRLRQIVFPARNSMVQESEEFCAFQVNVAMCVAVTAYL